MAIVCNGALELHATMIDQSFPLVPANVLASVDKIERHHSHYSMREDLILVFKNGQRAKLELKVDFAAPISDIALKEFQALCIMVHDI